MATLAEFVAAQDRVWPQVTAELRAGRKTSHWMWFVFPQIAGLGSSPMAQHYALPDRQAARAYFAHPVLGPRLAEAAALVLSAGNDPRRMLGEIDALKLRSSMTLFEAVPGAPAVFADLLDRLYGGDRCPRSLAALR